MKLTPLQRLVIVNRLKTGDGDYNSLAREYRVTSETIRSFEGAYDCDYACMVNYLLYIIWYLKKAGYDEASRYLYAQKGKITRGAVGDRRDGKDLPDFDINYLVQKDCITEKAAKTFAESVTEREGDNFGGLIDDIL